MMTRSSIVAAMILSLAVGVGPVLAEDAAPAPAAKTTTTSSKSIAAKKAISKACSDQANAKGLHGEERKKFRAACKKNGGKPAE